MRPYQTEYLVRFWGRDAPAFAATLEEPPYEDLVDHLGNPQENGPRYVWFEDEASARWMTRLDFHLAGARRLARKRAVEAAEERRRVAAARKADAKLTPEERRQQRLEMEEAVRLGCATAYEAEDSFSARFKKEGL